MDFIKLVNVSKRYKLSNNRTFLALRDINLTLPSSGFISILGKSGCGKSTLLNILALLDEPTSGSYYFNGTNMTKLSHLEKEDYLSNKIGIIFQHYQLIEDKDPIFNISLPMLIAGSREKETNEDATMLLDGINFDKNNYKKKVNLFSGGEKQRIAILRALINSPHVLLCDEPTGALDTDNSKKIMEILKKASKNKLVVMVSHNEELINEYSDRVITLKDGCIVKDEYLHEIKGKGIPITKDIYRRKRNKWIEEISLQNFKKRVKSNIFSIVSLSLLLVVSILISGFARYSEETISNESKKRLDYGALTIAKEEKVELEGSIISLVQETRPSELEQNVLLDNFDSFIYTNNYDVLLPSGNDIYYFNNKLDKLLFRPIYSFDSSNYDPSLLIKGALPQKDSFNEVLINKQGYQYILNETKKDILNEEINVDYQYESLFYTFDAQNNVIKDIFSLSKNFKIVGVVDEMDFLSSPTVYFSYNSFINYLKEYLLNNLSTYFKRDISWKERIDTASDNDELTSYSIRAFLKDYQNNSELKENINNISNFGLKATSLSILVEDSLSDLISASTAGMEIFLVISIIGIVLILGIMSYFSYSQDRKRSAILSALGASKWAIMKIYLFESMLVGLFSYFLTIILSFPLTKLTNYIVSKITNIDGLVKTPYYLFTHFKYDYLFFLLIAIALIITASTLLPIFFSKKISISEELRDE